MNHAAAGRTAGINFGRLVLFLFLGAAVLAGCSSLPPDSRQDSSWRVKERRKIKGTIHIASVSADRYGEWGSLEKELKVLAPLFFLEYKYHAVSPSVPADFTAELTVREREYPRGWQTRRSLSAEVRIWKGDADGPLPVSAGRALITGKQSLASSKTLNRLFRKALKNAVRGIPSMKRRSHSAAEAD